MSEFVSVFIKHLVRVCLLIHMLFFSPHPPTAGYGATTGQLATGCWVAHHEGFGCSIVTDAGMVYVS